jgi:hypothetical protein
MFMRRSLIGNWARYGVVIGISAFAAWGISAAPGTPDCVQVSAQAVYRNYGYDHLVSIANACQESVMCVVSTNVNPEPQRVEVAPKERADVLTFRGSPSRAFVPKVACRLASAAP